MNVVKAEGRRWVPGRLFVLGIASCGWCPSWRCSPPPWRPRRPGLLPEPLGPAQTTTSAVVVGAGDIASCTSNGDTATARLLANISGTVLAIGDNAYGEGSLAQFNNCYGPPGGSSRRAPSRWSATTSTAPPGLRATSTTSGGAGRQEGLYSYNRGAWHIIALNSSASIGRRVTRTVRASAPRRNRRT
jgi:hypothetical protein